MVIREARRVQSPHISKGGRRVRESERSSSSERAARVLKTVKDEEWRALGGLERGAMLYGTADSGMVSRLSRLPRDRVTYALDQLNKKGLAVGMGMSFSPTSEAIEILALHDYVRRDLISALGPIIAKGKESDVYEALNEEGKLFALKFFKLGRTSFTRVRTKRSLDKSEVRSWITANYDAAKREYQALKMLEGLSESFPKAVAYNRSTVLFEQLSGVRLSQRPELVDPRSLLQTVLKAARLAYKTGLVNGDLSEYNILTDGVSAWLIDWPQAVPTSHPNAQDLVAHDVRAVVRFFKRAYALKIDEEAALAYVTGYAASLE
jgi:RIO kinase 2